MPDASQLNQIYDDIEAEGDEEWAGLRHLIQTQADPSEGVRERLLAQLRALLPELDSGAAPADIAKFLHACSQERRDAFYTAWSRVIYSLEEVEEEWGLRKKPRGESLQGFFTKQCKAFYEKLLKDDAEISPLKSQRETSLKAVAPMAIAEACERLAVGAGLPKDGHLVHACLQGQAGFFFRGQDGRLSARAMLDSESEWNIAGSKLPLIPIANSAAGKDNLKDLVQSWLSSLDSRNLSATKVFSQGNLTVTGLLKTLRSNHNQLQLLQSEMEKFVNKKRQQYMQESDCIELLDGSPNFGKGTGADTVCIAPNVWALVFSTKAVYLREFGSSDSCGRLRFVVLSLDSSQVQATAFHEKLVPRVHSHEMIVGCLGWLLTAQHKVVEERSAEEPGQKEAEASQSSHTRRSLRLRRRSPAAPEAKPDPPLTQKAIDKVTFSGSAGCVLAGVQDGSGAACAAFPSCAGASTVTKHAGRMFGAICLSNLAIRNGLMMYILETEIPLDATVRLHDALAALPRCELYSINQLYLEQQLAKASSSNAAPDKPAAAPSTPADLDLAARRFFDGLLSYEAPCKSDAWKEAVDKGVPFIVPSKTLWYNFRQCLFARKRKRCPELAEYGGTDLLVQYGNKEGWTRMLDYLKEKHVAVSSTDGKRICLRYSLPGHGWLQDIRVKQEARSAYAEAPRP